MIHADTSFVIDLLREARRGGGPATELLEALPDEEIRICVFVRCELLAGVRLSNRSEQELQQVDGLCGAWATVYPDERFAEVYADIFAALRREGWTVAALDLLIGTAARVEHARLVTGNVRHFARIPDLEIVAYGDGAV